MFVVVFDYLFQPVGIKQTLKEWIQCLYGKVIDSMFATTYQSKTHRRDQTLRHDCSHFVLIQYIFAYLL